MNYFPHYGALDMASNIWEWVADWFQPGYNTLMSDNQRGPAGSRHRGIRDGGWNNPSAGVRAVQREGVRPEIGLDTLGFRCVELRQ